MNKIYCLVLALSALLCACNSRDGGKENNAQAKDMIKGNRPKYVIPQYVDISGSTNIEEILSQTWEMADDIEALADATDDGKITLPFRAFHLSDDHSFIKNPRNAMEYGTWSYDDAGKLITFKYSTGETDRYKIKAVAADELKLTNKGLNTVSVLTFIGSGTTYRNHQPDPFHIDNNRWRIPPAKPEDAAAIRQRLKACLHFFILFYNDNIARESKVVSFYGFPSCLKWYGGGIYLKKKEELPENWTECFYNKDQAMKAYNLMDSVIGLKYTWSKDPNKNWLVKNAEVLQQMYDKL